MTVKKIFAPILLVVATVFLLGSMFLMQPQAAFAQEAMRTVDTTAQSTEQVTNPKAEVYKQLGAEFANARNQFMQQWQALKAENQSLKDQPADTPAEMASRYQELGAKYKQLGQQKAAHYKELGMKKSAQYKQAWAGTTVN